ncbi:PEP-CTERM sorting domain-containing protein [Pseudanabaenaceae cyanobacterium LEGE 13415]|nr:PEP-CTERM sorting domain-containing protein [Pseudanabaenaceae cyanobacterium LEGE 13415]
MTTVQQNKSILAAFTIAVSFSAIAALKTDAAIITSNNPSTLAAQGFDLISVPNGAEPVGTDISTLNFPLGNIEFSSSVNKRTIGNGWQTWSNGYTGEVYFTKGASAIDITLPNLSAFDFYAQPDVFGSFTISAIAQSGEASDVLSQVVNGNAGAQYFGFYSDDPLDPIRSIRITADPGAEGFAIAQLRGARRAVVPTPLLLPGVIGLGLGLWRKARNKQSTN